MSQAVFLVGGRGSRLGAATDLAAKPTLEIRGRPFLSYLLDEAARHGARSALLLCGYRGAEMAAAYRGVTVRGMRVEATVEPSPMGTGGAVALALESGLLEETFFLANGDTLFDCNWLSLVSSAPITMALADRVDGDRYDRVRLNGAWSRRVVSTKAAAGPISAGLYHVRRDLTRGFLSRPCSLESDVLPLMMERGLVDGVCSGGSFIDIGVPEDLERAQSLVPAIARRPAVFLDRDGVLNVDHGHVSSVDRFEWVEGAREAVRWINDAGYLALVVTNQGGVARGLYTSRDVDHLHAWMSQELAKAGAHVDAYEYCVDLDSEMRKPRAGMLRKLMSEWSIDASASMMIGDRETDVETAKAAGVSGHLFQGGSLLSYVSERVPRLRAMRALR